MASEHWAHFFENILVHFVDIFLELSSSHSSIRISLRSAFLALFILVFFFSTQQSSDIFYKNIVQLARLTIAYRHMYLFLTVYIYLKFQKWIDFYCSRKMAIHGKYNVNATRCERAWVLLGDDHRHTTNR